MSRKTEIYSYKRNHDLVRVTMHFFHLELHILSVTETERINKLFNHTFFEREQKNLTLVNMTLELLFYLYYMVLSKFFCVSQYSNNDIHKLYKLV